MTIKRILHPSDFSRAARPAFALAQQMAKVFKAELILFHAYPLAVPMVGEGYIPPKVLEDLRTAERRQAERKLEGMATSTRQARIRASTLLAEGPPAPAIVRAAKRKRAGLLVLGTHGRTGLRRMLMGSVAERVVRTAPCPVLTVGPGKG